jgi:CubicO group peptidase (beta-lactamase class C family)
MTAKVSRSLFYILIVALPACGGGGSSQSPAPPPPMGFTYEIPADRGDSWAVASATEQGIDVPSLEAMMDAVASGQFPVIDSIAIDAGHISGVDVPYLSLFSYSEYANWDERKNDITLEHVLTMQLGLQWNEWDPPYTSVENQWNRFYANEHDFSKAVLDLPMSADPGTQFAYNTAATVSLGQAVENVAPLSLIDFGLNELMLPLGITEIEVTRTPTGLPNGGGGFFLRTRDVAKFGQLLLNDGTWNGERLVSSEWLRESVIPRTAIGWDDPDQWEWQVTGYGYQWWTGFYDHNGEIVDTVVAWGFGGQWVIPMPSLDLVVAINSNSFDDRDEAINQAHALVRRHILPALR